MAKSTKASAGTLEMPNRKVGVGAIAGALSVVIVSGFGMYGFTVTPEMAASLPVVASFIVSYMVKEPA